MVMPLSFWPRKVDSTLKSIAVDPGRALKWCIIHYLMCIEGLQP